MSSAVPRNRNPTYLIVAGLVVALLGGVLVFVLVSSPGGKITVPGTGHAVVVAARAVPAHAQLTAADVKVVQLAAELVPDHALTTAEQAVGRFAIAPISRNLPLTQDLLAGTAQAATSSGVTVPAGQVAVVIPPSEARASVSGLVQSGDRIDILVHNLPGQSPGQVATTFTDLPINVLAGASGTAAQNQSWVVYLPLQKAEELTYLLINGQYTFVVHPSRDSTPTTAPPAVGRDEFNSVYSIH